MLSQSMRSRKNFLECSQQIRLNGNIVISVYDMSTVNVDLEGTVRTPPKFMTERFDLVAWDEILQDWSQWIGRRGPRRIKEALSSYVYEEENAIRGAVSVLYEAQLELQHTVSLDQETIMRFDPVGDRNVAVAPAKVCSKGRRKTWLGFHEKTPGRRGHCGAFLQSIWRYYGNVQQFSVRRNRCSLYDV